jgi:hypothetical protein
MAKFNNIRVRESVVEKYPYVTSRIGNELLLTQLQLNDYAMREFLRLPESSQKEITLRLLELNFDVSDSVRLFVSRIFDTMDLCSPEAYKSFTELHYKLGDFGVVVLHSALLIARMIDE